MDRNANGMIAVWLQVAEVCATDAVADRCGRLLVTPVSVAP